MGAMKQWEIEKRALAEAVYALLADLVGNVEALKLTGASLSWRTTAGVQGHWREDKGQVWVGRIVPDLHGAGTVSEQLVLDLEHLGTGEDRVGMAHPAVHHWRTADGQVAGAPSDTGRIYAAAHGLLTQLAEELRTMLPAPREEPEETGDEA